MPARGIVDSQCDSSADSQLTGVISFSCSATIITQTAESDGAHTRGGLLGIVDVGNTVDQRLCRSSRYTGFIAYYQRTRAIIAAIGVMIIAGLTTAVARQINARTRDDNKFIGSFIYTVNG